MLTASLLSAQVQEEEEGKANKMLVPGLIAGGLAGILGILALTPLTNADQL